MAHISKHGDRWRAQVAKQGIRKSAVWDTKREALQWSLKVEAEIEAGTDRAKEKTFADAILKYQTDVSAQKKGARWEAGRLSALLDHFGTVRLGDLDAPDMAAWRDKRLKTVSASTVVRETNLLKHVLSTARNEWRWLDHDPFRGVKLPAEDDPRHQRWRWQQIKRVLRAGQNSGPKTREVTEAFHIALRTGMRLQEVLAAPQGFDASRRVVVLESTKTTGRALVPVGRIAAKLLTRKPFTVRPNEASTLFARLTRQLLIEDLTFHDSRGSALTWLSKRVDVMTLARISRHKDLSLLMRVYYRESADEIAAKLR